MKNDHISKKQFLIEFFGPLGRSFGDPKQWFTDNPTDIFEHVETCKNEKKPAFISVQPMTSYHGIYGIEKLFYDWDYGRKSDKYTEKQIKRHKVKLKREIRIFINTLRKFGITPLIVKTRKGYHFYVYFDQIYEIRVTNSDEEDFWRKVYHHLRERLLRSNHRRFKYVDSTSKEDIFRLCRVPMSIHEKSGEECVILDMNLKPTKFRSIEYYRLCGIKRGYLTSAVETVSISEKQRKKKIAELEASRKDRWDVEHGFTGTIRPCFQKFMKAGEAPHQVRLAMAIESFYCGYKTREAMVEWFRWGNDWDGHDLKGNCWTQVNWFFDNKVDESRHGESRCRVKPYKCDTIRVYGWCIEEDCPIYRKQKEKGKIGKTKRKKT